MSDKTHHTAVVAVPPEECWEPIQAIRRQHDRQFRRWMPHITLLYPFRPREMFTEAAVALRTAVADVDPFEITLREIRHFHHGRRSYTIWLAPEPVDELKHLQAVLQVAVPNCNDVARHAGGFTPHLSLGQARSAGAMEGVIRSLQDQWRPLTFTLARVSLIWRNDPPDDVFRVDRHIVLGKLPLEQRERDEDMRAARIAVIFDLDGVLTDTAELHYQSWQRLMDEVGVPFDRRINEALRGLSRRESLETILGARSGEFAERQKEEIARRKNDEYLTRVVRMTPADLLPGAGELLQTLRKRGAAVAVASSSKNAEAVLDRLGIRPLLDVLVDGNDIERSKPDPEVFLRAAERLGVPPARCVVVEDAASGVAAALAAGMRVVGLGPPERVNSL
jgi:beta-phosphoglucomutase